MLAQQSRDIWQLDISSSFSSLGCLTLHLHGDKTKVSSCHVEPEGLKPSRHQQGPVGSRPDVAHAVIWQRG
jgi:hypothetical protein